MLERGQEELVGFVLVVVLVSIIGLVILGLVFKIDGREQETRSADIEQFLESAFSVNAPCHLTSPRFPATLRELAEACANDKETLCLDEEKTCSVLNLTMKGLINTGWRVGESSAMKGYELQITLYKNKTGGAEKSVLVIGDGKCGGDYKAGEHIQPGTKRGTSVVTTLKLCTD